MKVISCVQSGNAPRVSRAIARRSVVPAVAGSVKVAPGAKSPFQSPRAATSIARSARRAQGYQSTRRSRLAREPGPGVVGRPRRARAIAQVDVELALGIALVAGGAPDRRVRGAPFARIPGDDDEAAVGPQAASLEQEVDALVGPDRFLVDVEQGAVAGVVVAGLGGQPFGVVLELGERSPP